MDGIGFTDEELGRLNTATPGPTSTAVASQRRGQIGEQKRKTYQGQSRSKQQSQLVVDSKQQPSAVESSNSMESGPVNPPRIKTPVDGELTAVTPVGVAGGKGGTKEPQGEAEKELPVGNNLKSKPKIETLAGKESTENDNDDDVNPFASDDHKGVPQPPMTKIESLQQKQITLERQNRERQKALKDTLSERFNKTAEQAKLLQTMQGEVTSIERELSCDISLLRDRIDRCNMRYSEARKRHEEAEREYVASKLELHHCVEQKEALEEHLYTIITMNEQRKSDKLEQLHIKMKHFDLERQEQ